MTAKQFWLVPVAGFDPQVAVGEESSDAILAVFHAAKEAGHFTGAGGLHEFLRAASRPYKCPEHFARALIGEHKAAGEE